jgi:polysaccharide export outer membrane protein
MNRFNSKNRHSSFSSLILLTSLSLLGTGRIVSAQSTVPTLPSTGVTNSDPSSISSLGLDFAPPLLINSGDLLEVQVFGTPELSGRLRVDQNGVLHLSLGGDLQVAGRTAQEVSDLIEGALRTKQIMLDPHVKVFVVEYVTQGVTVTGEVKRPGVYPLYGSVSLYEALSAAGGFTTTAGSSITIAHRFRGTAPTLINVTSPNYSAIQNTTMLTPGDTVVVAAADLVYVVGEVGKQGAVPLPYGQPLTVLKLLSLSAGLTQVSKGSKAAIVRQTSSDTVTTIDVDLPSILKSRAPNLVMQANDILVVPRSKLKEFLQIALPSITNAVSSSAVTAVLVR